MANPNHGADPVLRNNSSPIAKGVVKAAEAAPKILTIGHLPPPWTGENILRDHLEQVCVRRGCTVMKSSRFSLLGFQLAASKVVVVTGQSGLATFLDLLFAYFHRCLGHEVWFYVHNRSWRRLLRIPFRWLMAPLRQQVILLIGGPSFIAERMKQAGHLAREVPNTAGEKFDWLEQKLLTHPNETKRLLWMGRPENEKGFDVAIEAFLLLRKSDASWRFDVYGSEGKGLPDPAGVHYHGFVKGDAKTDAFYLGGIFILPSRYKNETQPVSIIEALAAGLPVVASNVGGIPEMLKRGSHVAGITIDLNERSPRAYADAVEACICSYAAYSASAQQIYRSYFSHKKYAENVINCLSIP